MANRRSLIVGIKPEEDIDPDMAEDFIAGRKPRPAAKKASRPVAEAPAPLPLETPAPPPPARHAPAAVSPPAPSPLTGVGRVPVGARFRTELAAALKRTSLERQLQGIQPNSVQDILEEALELWLHKHGLLK
jgi:hypothetical protein